MATFTVELYRVAELRGTIGLDDYPIFSEAYRTPLNQKIYDHFIDREIGQESVPRFLHAMQRKMNEIMPMYNQLYESQKLVIDPLNTMSIETIANALGSQTSNGSSTTNNENTSESNSTDRRTSNNTSEASGQGQVIQSEFAQTILRQDKDYATTGSESTNKSANTAAGTDTGTGKVTDTASGTIDGTASSEVESKDQTTSNVTGWQGSQSELLQRFRATFLNIDMDIIRDLEELFMFVWTSGDSYTNRSNGIYYS